MLKFWGEDVYERAGLLSWISTIPSRTHCTPFTISIRSFNVWNVPSERRIGLLTVGVISRMIKAGGCRKMGAAKFSRNGDLMPA